MPLAAGSVGAYGLGTTCAIAVVLALGLQVTYGMAGALSLAHVPLMGVGAYAVALLSVEHGWSFWAALPVGVGAAAATSAVVGLPALRLQGDVLALTTLGAGEILQTLFLRSSVTGGYQGVSGVPPVRLGGTELGERGLYLLAVTAAALALLLTRALLHAPVGRAWTAARDDELAAAAFGVRAGPLRLLAFAIGAGIAGVGGALFAVHDGFVSSVSFGLPQTVVVVLVVLMAGPAHLLRTVVSAVGFTLVVDRLVGYGGVSEGVTGGLILLVLAWRLGLAAAVAERVRRVLPARRPQVEVSMPATPVEPLTAGGAGLVLRAARHRYGGVLAVDGVDLTVRPGEVVGLVGPNGSGKTTVVNLVTGRLRPDEGRLEVDGRDLMGAPPHALARAGVVRSFQGLRLFEGRSVLDNVLVGADVGRPTSLLGTVLRTPAFRRDERIARAAAGAALSEVGLPEGHGRSVGALSHGQRRRVELARAFAARPRYLVLDEPGAGLDPEQTAELARLLRARRDAGCGLLVVEHDIELLAAACDRAVGLADGRVVATGALADVQRHPALAAHLGVPA